MPRGITSKSAARRELLRRLFSECVKIQLKLTQCCGCKGWHFAAEVGGPVIELDERKAFQRLWRQWRDAYKVERRFLILSSPLICRWEMDFFPEMHARVASRTLAMRRLWADNRDLPLADHCKKLGIVERLKKVAGI